MTQADALTILKTGANVFLTGEPGSGKTYTINQYVAYLRSRGIEPAITASTGIASTHIGGMTVHAWSGIGVKSVLSNEDLDAISQKERVAKRIMKAKVLIIDEISMLSADTLHSVDRVCRMFRNKLEPFGGIQIVVVGDFFQLPPIVRAPTVEERELTFEWEEEKQKPTTPFSFRSPAWKDADFLTCYLSEQHRQEDAQFLEVLNAIRVGAITPEVRAVLRSRATAPQDDVTRLYPHNANVDRLNDAELKKISADLQSFVMKSSGAPLLVEGLKRNCLSPEVLSLKVGAKVMFTKNSMEGKFVNGTTGEVIGFSKATLFPIVKTRSGRLVEAEPLDWTIQDGDRILAKIQQVPLRLAWAITVHKSQGMSLDSAVMDLSSAFEYGQGYVALSRVRTLEGLYLVGFNDRALQVHPEVAERDTLFRKHSSEAGDTFSKLPPTELSTMHLNFVKALGGSLALGAQAEDKKKKIPTVEVTRSLLLKGLVLSEIMKERGLTLGTIVTHLEELVEEKKITKEELAHLEKAHKKEIALVQGAYNAFGSVPLKAVFEHLKGKVSYEIIRLGRMLSSGVHAQKK